MTYSPYALSIFKKMDEDTGQSYHEDPTQKPDFVGPEERAPYKAYGADALFKLKALHGHELAANYAPPMELPERQRLSAMAKALEDRHGLIDVNTMISSQMVPTGLIPSKKPTASAGGETYIRGLDYPASNPYARAIYLNDAGILRDANFGGVDPRDYKASVLDHELHHAQEYASGGPATPEGGSNDNSKRHFPQSDTPGQMFNYEGRDALKMMLDRLQRHAKGLP